MSENYKRILTFKRDQGGSFQFRLLSVIIETSVKVRAFLDFCLRYKYFSWKFEYDSQANHSVF